PLWPEAVRQNGFFDQSAAFIIAEAAVAPFCDAAMFLFLRRKLHEGVRKVAGLTVVADVQVDVVAEMFLPGELPCAAFGKGYLVVSVIAVSGGSPAVVADA
ncbi:hypothetical protein, partial [Citrobacter sp. wls710]|uniref:hypothetical protein n=1 Tax=Citrobacter sp. wls710 TaxID=2576426 RepID=UPI001484D9B4